jgi:outer membrane protein assembly factor BamB
MRLSKLAAYLIIILLIQTCYSTEPDNGDPPPLPGYQEDIPWPSLADSPWPMHHGNPQSNGRSRFNGPQNGNFEKVFDSPELFGIVIGPDSTIYCSSSDFVEKGLFAYSPNGELKWHLPTKIESQTTPLVSSGGIIYFSTTSTLYAINHDGAVKWEYEYGNHMYIRGINIGLDGKIYFITINSEICAVDKDGQLVWKMQAPIQWGNNSIVFSPDGETIYCVGGVAENISLVAIDIVNSNVKWSFGKHASRYAQIAPIVDSDGNIYTNAIVDSINSGLATIFSLYPDGKIRWALEIGEVICSFQPTMDREGNIYFANDTLYAIDFMGKLKWKLPLGGYLGEYLVCDASDNIYLCIGNPELLVYAVEKEGNFKWQLSYPIAGDVESFALGYGELYIPASKEINFYLIK